LLSVHEFLMDATPPAALAILGDAGIGKTALWRAAVAEAESQGRRILAARPVEAEADMPFAGLDALLNEVVDEVIDELPTPQRVALEVALLRRTPDPRGIEARAVASAIRSTLLSLAAIGPVLVAIDDLQWLDHASLGALQAALGRLSTEDVLVISASRPNGPQLTVELSTTLHASPLDVEGIRALVRDRLDTSLSLPAARRLHERSGGNPFYALELARTDDPAMAVRELAGQRLRGMPARTRDALGTIAALGHPRAPLVAKLVGDESVLDPAYEVGLLEHDGHEIRFAHPLLAAAAYAALPPGRRRAAHLRLAELATAVDERARHVAAATNEPDERVAAEISAGAAAAAARGAPGIAAELLDAAARLTPPTDTQAQAKRRLDAARHLFATGDDQNAVERCRHLIAELPSGGMRAEALITLAWHGIGPLDECLEMAGQAVAEAESPEARGRHLLLLTNIMMTQDVDRALELAREALELLEQANDPALRAYAMGFVGTYDVWTHPGGFGVRLLRQAYALEREHGTRAEDVYFEAASALGGACYQHDELDEARELLERQHRRAAEAGREAEVSGIALHLAEVECRAGNLDAARAYADEMLAAVDDGHDSQPLGAALYARAYVAALQGDAELAVALADRSLRVGAAVGDRIFPILSHGVLGMLALSMGDAQGAIEHLDPLPEAARALGQRDPGWCGPLSSDRIEALVGVGRLDEADAANREFEALGSRLDRPRVLATAARGRGVIAAARGDLAAGIAALHEALGHHSRLPSPHERARTLLALGASLRRAGRRRDARDALDEALATFESLGESLWAARVKEEARRLGGRTRGGDALTAAERQVAELVAAGRSNREVADALFVTVRTVESNLTRIYRKLGVRSRAGLAARWRASRDEVPAASDR
jgi:DNA-binding CsgD family transcriptional regulator